MSEISGSRFVGREVELMAMRAELDAALRGEGRLAVLLGEPGIGKTRTASTLATEARAAGAHILWGRCRESEGAPAYWPWVQALDSHVADAGEGTDGIAAALAGLRGDAGQADGDEVPERARFELFYRVVTALAAAARVRPLVIVLDDLHWADIGSLVLLDFVARELATMPVFVLGTARDAELAQRTHGAARLSAVMRLGRGVPLAGLSVAEVGDLVRDRLGRSAEADLIGDVAALTDGNPFFVIEMLHLLAADRASPARRRGPLTLPPGVRGLLQQRLAPLPAATRRALEVAAVVGRDFDLDLLGRPLAAAPDAVERAALAHHFFEAAQSGDPAKAIRYQCDAGERALDVFAFEEAVRHFERALAAASGTADDATRLRVLAGLGEAVHGAGDPPRAEAVFRDAIAVARRAGAHAFADTVLRCAAVRAEFALTDLEMNGWLEEAVAALPSDPTPLRARLLARLAAGLSLQQGAEQRRRTLADEATAMARRLGDPATLGYVLQRRLIGLLGPDTLEERLATTAEIVGARSSTSQATLGALMFRADDLAQRGDRAGLDDVLIQFEQRARTGRQPFYLWMVASFRAAVALLEGRLGEAEGLAGEALAAGQRVQPRTALLYYSQQLFMLRAWQGRFAEIEPFIGMSMSETSVMPAWRCGLAAFYDMAGRYAEARREFEALAVDGFATQPRDTTWLEGMYLLANVCARQRDARRAAVLYDYLRPFAGRIAVGWPLVVILGSIDECLGSLAAAQQDYACASVRPSGRLPDEIE